MNIFTLVFAFVAIVAMMGGTIYALIRDSKQLKAENKKLQNALASARENVVQLTEFVEKLNKINAEEMSVSEQIKEAKDDEEVYDIISGIINSNNLRVQNN